jgi:hypothetical protein
MPVYLVLLTGWFKVFGFGLLALRSFTIWCGLAALLPWFSIVHKLTHNPAPGILGSVLIAIDYGFALCVSEGRPLPRKPAGRHTAGDEEWKSAGMDCYR